MSNQKKADDYWTITSDLRSTHDGSDAPDVITMWGKKDYRSVPFYKGEQIGGDNFVVYKNESGSAKKKIALGVAILVAAVAIGYPLIGARNNSRYGSYIIERKQSENNSPFSQNVLDKMLKLEDGYQECMKNGDPGGAGEKAGEEYILAIYYLLGNAENDIYSGCTKISTEAGFVQGLHIDATGHQMYSSYAFLVSDSQGEYLLNGSLKDETLDNFKYAREATDGFGTENEALNEQEVVSLHLNAINQLEGSVDISDERDCFKKYGEDISCITDGKVEIKSAGVMSLITNFWGSELSSTNQR